MTNRLGCMKLAHFSWLVLAIILFATSYVCAQDSTGSISGAVRDAFDAAVNGADVTLTNSQQVALSNTRTDAQGHFKFDGVAAGSYVLIISRSDFSVRRQAVRVAAGGTAEVNVI